MGSKNSEAIKILSNYDPSIRNAGYKAKYDIEQILTKEYEECTVCAYKFNDASLNTPLKARINSLKRIAWFIGKVKKGDIVIVQHPITLGKYWVFSKIIMRNASKTICIVHDLDGLRAKDEELSNKQNEFLKSFDYVISHNEAMTKELVRVGIKKEKIINLTLFDYLCEDEEDRKNTFSSKRPKVVYSGNLAKEKCPFLYQLDDINLKFDINLYGVGFDEGRIKNKERIRKKGCFSPDKPSEIEGDLGLVWDGLLSALEDENTTKNYNKYNNPHKLSCYLAAGIPVIVWRKAAIAKFVEENNIGYLIDGVDDINKLDFSDYDEKFKAVKYISKRVRDGYYIKKAIKKAL